MLQAVQSMDKKQFITLCKNDPEQVYKLFCVMGETITTLRAEVVLLNEQVETLQEEVKNLKSRLDQNSRNSNIYCTHLQTNSSSQKARVKKAARKQAGKRATRAIP
jgi:uncharacterized protein YlxW (UPF0749 family)